MGVVKIKSLTHMLSYTSRERSTLTMIPQLNKILIMIIIIKKKSGANIKVKIRSKKVGYKKRCRKREKKIDEED